MNRKDLNDPQTAVWGIQKVSSELPVEKT